MYEIPVLLVISTFQKYKFFSTLSLTPGNNKHLQQTLYTQHTTTATMAH
jgi:hypothetical protein